MYVTRDICSTYGAWSHICYCYVNAFSPKTRIPTMNEEMSFCTCVKVCGENTGRFIHSFSFCLIYFRAYMQGSSTSFLMYLSHSASVVLLEPKNFSKLLDSFGLSASILLICLFVWEPQSLIDSYADASSIYRRLPGI